MDRGLLAQARSLLETSHMLRGRVASRLHQTGSPMAECPELTLPQMNMVQTVIERGRVTIKQLAEALQVSAPSASAMVERLVELGALTREQSKVDRREVVIAISPDAERRIRRLEEQMLDSIAEILDKIGPQYAQMWCDVYERIREVLQQEALQPGVPTAANN